jgi:hypothetical protein
LKGLGKDLKRWSSEAKRDSKELRSQIEDARSELNTLLRTVDGKIHVLKERATMQPISLEAMKDGKVSFLDRPFLRVFYHMEDGSTPEDSVDQNSSLQCASAITIGEKPRFMDNRRNEVSSTYPVTAIRVQGETAYITLGPEPEGHLLAIDLKKPE